jgi:hypothetical protein
MGYVAWAWRSPGPGERADLHEFQAECLHLGKNAEQGRAVQQTGQHGVSPLPPRYQRRERGQRCGTELALQPDRVQGRDRIHGLMIAGWQVSLHRQNQVTRALVMARTGGITKIQ